MYLCTEVSFWIALPISALAAGFLVRIFIIQHDCGHGSFFTSKRAFSSTLAPSYSMKAFGHSATDRLNRRIFVLVAALQRQFATEEIDLADMSLLDAGSGGFLPARRSASHRFHAAI